jgi:hypothetical protein
LTPWSETHAEDVVIGWGYVKKHCGDDIAQQVACYALQRQPEGGVVGYIRRVGFLHWKWGYHDGRRWTGTGQQHHDYDRLESTVGWVGLKGQAAMDKLIEEAHGHAPDPAKQIEARELLKLADPRLIQAAENAHNGALGEVPGVSRQHIHWLRQQFIDKAERHMRWRVRRVA